MVNIQSFMTSVMRYQAELRGDVIHQVMFISYLMCPPNMSVMGVRMKSACRVMEVLFLGPTCSHSSSLPSSSSSSPLLEGSSVDTWETGPFGVDVSAHKQTNYFTAHQTEQELLKRTAYPGKGGGSYSWLKFPTQLTRKESPVWHHGNSMSILQ